MDENKDDVHITLDDAISKIGLGRVQYMLLILTAGGYLATCSELLVFVFSSDAIASLWGISNDAFAWLPFSTSITGIFGSFLFGIISDYKGRQMPFIVSIAISAIFSLASAFAPNFKVFILLRCCVSFGIGGIVAVDFVILSEFLPRIHRGQFMVILTLSGALGVAYTAGMAWLLAERHWHLFIVICAIPTFLVFIIRFIVNIESPRFLLSKGNYEKALKILNIMARKHKCPDALNGFKVIDEQEIKSRNFFHLFSREFIVQTLQISTLWFLQATGYWGVTIFFPKYLARFGIAIYFDMFMNICAQIPGYFLLIQMIDRSKIGRIWTLRLFTFGVMISLLLLTFLEDRVSVAVLAVICYFFMPPIFAILQIYTTEIYPTLLRSNAMSWASIVISLPGMTTTFISAKIVSSPKQWIYPLVWAVVFLLQLIVAMTLRKETAAQSIDVSSKEHSKYTVIDSEAVNSEMSQPS
eukprot:gene9087-10056_t